MPSATITSTDSPRHRRRWWLAAGLVGVVVVGVVGWQGGSERPHGATSDERAMAQRAAQVMPFDLNATTHTFTKTNEGGVETVVADDPGDQRNIALIREHLNKEATQFGRGDYSDPATIHGANMPGLQVLQAAGDRIRIRYTELPVGATITYASNDPVLVAALHSWFDAQSSGHAMPGMGG